MELNHTLDIIQKQLSESNSSDQISILYGQRHFRVAALAPCLFPSWCVTNVKPTELIFTGQGRWRSSSSKPVTII